MTQAHGLRALWSAFVPPARREAGLVLAALDDELLVYDETRHRAHALNGAAAQVLRRCDGHESIEGVARQLAQARQDSAYQLPQSSLRAAGAGQGAALTPAGGQGPGRQSPPLARMEGQGAAAHGMALQQALVWLAVLQLGRARLLAGRVQGRAAAPLPTRRELLRQLGRAAVALPAVASITAPTAMDTVSCSLLSCATKPCCITKLCSGPPNYLCL